MENVYYNIKDPDSFSTPQKLQKRTKKPSKEVNEWLSDQLAHSLTKPIKKRFPTRSYKANGPNDLWQMDLMEMIPFASINKGYKYILNVVDVYSRYVWAIPIKTKTGVEVANVLKPIVSEYTPINIQTDQGKEFYNVSVQKLFKSYNINHYSVYSQFKAAIVERFNRTLRTKLNKYFIYKGKKVWFDVLDDIVHAYNTTKHGGIANEKPIELMNNLNYNDWARNHISTPTTKVTDIKVDDYVRISRITSSPFIKNFDNNWSDEVFQVTKIDKSDTPIMYHIKDHDGDVLAGKFYYPELQKLPHPPSTYRIEQVLKSKGKGKDKQYLVKWVGYKQPTWIKANLIST